MRDALRRGATFRILLTSFLLAFLILTPLTYGLDSAGGHPAKSAPITITVFWFLLLAGIRLIVRRRRRIVAADNAEMARLHPEG